MLKQQDNGVIVDGVPRRRQPLANISANSNIKKTTTPKKQIKIPARYSNSKKKELQYL